jgi:hypothetical protein
VGGGSRVCGRASGCQWRPIGPDIPEHAFPRGRSPHPSADRVRGDRRRSLHSGNSDRRSADRLRGLPAAIISSEGPYGRRLIKNVKKGGVLIAGNSTVDNEKLKKLAVDKLSNAYEVKEVKPLNPRIRVVGMSEKWELEHLTSYLIQINKHLFSIKPECKIINFGPTKKNDKIFQALVQVDQDSYKKIMDAGRLIVGYDSCNVYDAIEVRRCFNCNEFQHIAANCKNQLTCPKCGLGHDLKNCKSTFKRCVNCY